MTCSVKLHENPEGHYLIELSGDLNFDSIVPVTKKASHCFKNSGKITVDLADITYVNSAGIGLLLEWNYLSGLGKNDFRIINIPEKLVNIARACNVDSILFSTH